MSLITEVISKTTIIDEKCIPILYLFDLNLQMFYFLALQLR